MTAPWDAHSSHGSLEAQLDAAAMDAAKATETEQERATLAKRETTVVARMELVLFVVLLATTALVSSLVYTNTKSTQERDFRHAFESDAHKLLDVFYTAVARQIESVDALSVAITSHALLSGATFPFVNVPDFGLRASNSRALSGSFMLGYYPIVTNENRKSWEKYVVDNREHPNDVLDLESALRKSQDAEFNFTDTNELRGWREPSDEIVQLDAATGSIVLAAEGSGPFLPISQLSPAPPDKSLLNFDTLSYPSFQGAHTKVMETGKAVIDSATSMDPDSQEGIGVLYALLLSLSQYRTDRSSMQGDPTSSFAYPVFDSFDKDRRSVAGVIGTSIMWKLFFNNVIPDAKGIYCVLENTLNQTYTYYLLDDKVSLVGEGDHHDPRFDGFEQSIDIASAKATKATLETKSLTSVELDLSYCNYKLRVYPSRVTEAQFVNQDPLTAMLVIVGVFAFTSLIFASYTVAVKRRQRVVMERAVASSAIVSSLFPSQIRDQIYEENNAVEQRKAWQRVSDVTESLNGALGIGSSPEKLLSDSPVTASTSTSTTRPIANLFESTTIMFADLVGFTQWSSTREPVQVFELLETLYQAFDAIAVRRRVFKVETIGDCYVAAAGLPDPQDAHAVIMVRFAAACLQKMSELLTDLAASLGPDTATLTMRVGLHSGSVTGGVLRGQKSRFQLFGDTMNTASRMETSGLAGRIHVSQETVDELSAKGKANWVMPRREKITVKGKGELQTYWVSLSPLSQKSSSYEDGGSRSFQPDDGSEYSA